jgi:hypothetical protein
MSTLELRRQAKQKVDQLSPKSLKSALDYLGYLEDRDEQDATEELLAIPGFEKDMAEARSDVAAGRLTPVTKLRRKFKR